MVDAAEAAIGSPPIVLRLLDADGDPHGGHVTYLVQVADVPDGLVPWSGELDDHPLRMPWARPGGPVADLAWAVDRLAELGRDLVAPPVQERTWNLSSLWRLPTTDGVAWLKVVPPFFAHEPAVIGGLDDPALPPLLAGEPGRSLLAEVPGEDGYHAGVRGWAEFVDALVRIQLGAVDRLDELVAAGVPQVGLGELVDRVAEVLGRRRSELSVPDLGRLESVLAAAPAAIEVVAELGPPPTIVHGDAHSGNCRFGPDGVTVLDWGDAFIGQPLLDLAVIESYAPELADDVIERWLDRWRRAGIGRVDEAWRAVAPLARLRAAVVFQDFLDQIEPAERRYHEADVVPALVGGAS